MGSPDRRSPCLDAEMLAALTDGGLTRDEQASVELHAASCARCQALLAAMARTEPLVATPTPERSWRRFLVPALVPLTAATAVAIYLAVPQPETLPTATPAIQTSAPAAQSTVAPEPPPQMKAAERMAESPTAEPPAAPAAVPTERRAFAAPAREGFEDKRTESGKRADDNAKLRGRLERQFAKEQALEAGKRPSDEMSANQALASAAPVAPLPAAEAPAAGMTPAAPPAAAPAARPAQAAAEERPRTLKEEIATLNQQKRVGGAVSQSAGGAALDVIAQDRAPGWRLVEGRIERSTDRGSTWTPSYSDTDAGLVAISSPSPNVAWAVGRAGVVVRTIDGRTWRRMTVPKTVDLVSVLASDANNAVAMAANGTVYVTKNGGESWQEQSK